MLSILGVLSFAAGIMILCLTAPWLRRQPAGGWPDRWMMAELTAIAVVLFVIFGVAFIVVALIEAQGSGETLTTAVASLAAAAVVVVVGIKLWQRGERRAGMPGAAVAAHKE